MGKFIDLAGQRFGRLTAIERIGRDKHKNVIWKCNCDCGNEVDVRLYQLRNGHTKSCGCLQKEIITKIQLEDNHSKKSPIGESSFNRLIRNYKNGAKNRNISFSLSNEEVKIITQQNCYYCGSRPSNIIPNYYNRGDYVYNGIDRIDSSKGYTEDNVVPCCSTCNTMKMAMGQQEFLDHIERIYNHSIKKKED